MKKAVSLRSITHPVFVLSFFSVWATSKIQGSFTPFRMTNLRGNQLLAEAQNWVRDVGLFEGGDLFGCEFDREGGYGVGQVVWFRRADDR